MIQGKSAFSGALFLASALLASAATGTVKVDRVNVRGAAGLNGEVITQLAKGEAVTILEPVTVKAYKGEPSNWLKIVLPANTPLWVNASFVGTNDTVSAKKLNVRGGPGENFSVVARLEKGAALKVLRKEGGWLEVQAPEGAAAFVVASYIEVVGSSGGLAKTESKPSVSAKPVPVAIPEPKPIAPLTEIKPEPAPIVAQDKQPEPEAPKPAPVPVPPPASVAVPAPVVVDTTGSVGRKVFREGIVRRDLHINTPSYFSLDDRETGNKIAFLVANAQNFDLHRYIGSRVVISGEEFLDDRWKRTPILKVETLDLP
jgi:uncharacterized protein YraI